MNELVCTVKELLSGIRLREDELRKKWQSITDSKSKEANRYDAFYTCYGLFGDCIESPHITKLDHIENYILRIKEYLKEADLDELRRLYNYLAEDLAVLLGNELGAKQIKLKEVVDGK